MLSGFAATKDSVKVALPLVALALGHVSLTPPPVAVQLLALVELHVSVVDRPAVMVVGDAESDAVTTGQVTSTATCP
jgi:hypothetical protein